jgi:hypothetical protein
MACLFYPYNATTQDLWLYENETIVHTGGTTVVLKPVAWNPNSPLYGYRRSLQGISLRRRLVTSSAATYLSPTQYAQASAINNPANPANTWVFNNCYPMPVYAVSRKLMFCCQHCFASSGARNPTKKWSGGVFPVGSLNDKLMGFQWMDGDNNITDNISPANVIAPYTTDTSPSLVGGGDAAITELEGELSFEPMKMLDPRNLAPGATIWSVDSAMKIVRLKYLQSPISKQFGINEAREVYDFRIMLPDGSAESDAFYYLHDSGSVAFGVISEPTSAAAGDGVLGLIPRHMVAGGEFKGTSVGYGEYPGYGAIASLPRGTNFRDYFAARGYPLDYVQAKRQHTNFALVSTCDRIVEKVNQLSI